MREKEEFPSLRGRQNVDVTVIGGGLTGLTTALWLTRAGLRVALLEARRIGSGASASCAGLVTFESGMFFKELEQCRGMAATNAFAQTQKSAFRALRELCEELGPQCGWRDTDVQIVADTEKAFEGLSQEAEAMRRAGVTSALTRSTQCPLPAVGALTLKDMGIVDTAAFLKAAAGQADKEGVKIYERSRVVALETNLAFTERGSVAAPYLVVATGYPIVNVPGWYFLRLVQRRGWRVEMEGRVPFEGAYLSPDGRYFLHRVRDGAMLTFAEGKEKRMPREQFEAEYAQLLGIHTVKEIAGGVEAFTADGLPFIGPYSAKTPNLFVATGYGKRGLLGAMTAAQAISARILGLPGEGYALYSGQRRSDFRLPLHIAGEYLFGLLAHPTAPRCPHMGCKLVYNAATRLWECPCHGSRFDDIGHVISAPAVHDAQLRRP